MEISEFREMFVGMNKLSFTLRLALGDVLQKWVVENKRRVGVEIDGVLLKEWFHTGLEEDKKRKRDSFCESKLGRKTSQIKARQPDSGSDIGVATIQPKPNLDVIVEKLKAEGFAFTNESTPKMWARDIQFDGELFECLENPHWDRTAVIRTDLMQEVVKTVLKEWISTKVDLDGSYGTNTFYSKAKPGVQLKCTVDAGKGWDSKKRKLITYIPADFFNEDQISFIEMDPPSDSLVEEVQSILNTANAAGNFFQQRTA